MSHVDKSLVPNELLMARGRWPLMFWLGAWAALLFLGIAVVGVFIFVRAAIIMLTTEFAVTDTRLILKRGWLNVKTQSLNLSSVEGVQMEQSIWGKLLGYGRVMVTGTGDARLIFPPMANPGAFRHAIESARDLTDRPPTAPSDVTAAAAS